MEYSINNGIWGKIFAVPTAVVDRHLKLANPLYIKVLLYFLRHENENINSSEAAKCCGVTVQDVEDAFTYWSQAGVLEQSAEVQSEREVKEKIVPAVSAQPVVVASKPVAAARTPKPTHEECARLLSERSELADLIENTQGILGRILSRADIDTLISLNVWAGMPIDVLYLVITHCVGDGKSNMRYIERVALSWLDKDVDTVAKADIYLKKCALRKEAWSKVISVTGIEYRKPSAREEEYSERWVFEWGFGSDMLRLAYDTCVNSTGKLAFGYMNKILERWNAADIRTPEALREDAERKKNVKSSDKKPGRSYNLDELEQRINFDMIDIANN